MLMLPPSLRIFVAGQPTDLRCGFDALAEATRQVLCQDPFSGHLLVYFNRARNRVKVLHWDRTGLPCQCQYHVPSRPRATACTICQLRSRERWP